MLKEIRDQLIIGIKEVTVNSMPIQRVDKYRGEFEEGSDWNPTSTACFLQVTGKRPRVKSGANEILKYNVTIRIYAGANFVQRQDALDVAEAVMDALDGSTLEFESQRYKMNISPDGMDFIYYEKGFEGYAFNLIVT